MEWFSFMFGVVTGISVVCLIGVGAFYVLLRPHLKAAAKQRGSSPGNVPPDLWMKTMKQSWDTTHTDQQ
jgi:hypothetical protein